MQAERNKQQYFLVNEAAAAAAASSAAASAYSSAARITPASSKQQPTGQPGSSAAAIVSRADAPAVIINERDRQHMALRMLTAQNVIDAIITQSIQGNPAQAGNPHDAAHKLPQHSEELVKAARAQLEQQQAQAAASEAAAARSSSRPPSGHEKPALPPDMVLNKELSITPAPASTAEDYLKKRQIMITTSATLTPTSSAAPTRVSDERQIIRVAQPVSPAKPGPPADLVEAARKATSPPNGDQPPPGMLSLDYVKNKIVEAMKKQGEDDGAPAPALAAAAAAAAAAAVAGTKRPSPDMTPEDVSSPKKKKSEDEAGASAGPPESPGSPGDMVIDESAQESTPKAASPATASTANPPASTAPSSADASALAHPGAPVNAPNASAAGAVGNSKYEPLSDDE